MRNKEDQLRKILKEFRMAQLGGPLSPMKSRADEEFAKLIKGVPLNEAQHSGLDEDTVMGIERLRNDGLDYVDILKALVYDVYHETSLHTIDMLKMMGYTDDQIDSDKDPMGGIPNIAASEFIDMSDLEAETFLINYLKTLPEMERSDDLRAIEMANQAAKDEWYEERHILDQEAWMPAIPPDYEKMVEYLNTHGFDIGDDYMFKGDNLNEPYYIEAKTLEIGDHIAQALDPESGYGNDENHPFFSQTVDVNHHRMNVTWKHTVSLREMTRHFIREVY